MAFTAPAAGVVLSLAYLCGLLATAVPGGNLGLLGLSLVFALGIKVRGVALFPLAWRSHLKKRLVVLAGVTSVLAGLYLFVRTPTPDPGDISRFLASPTQGPAIATVQGQITSPPHLTRSQRVQFWLDVQAVNPGYQVQLDQAKPSTGKLYVTVPILQGTGLYPGQAIAVTGTLYQPSTASNPGGFDFQNYLAQEGSFTGLKGQKIQFPEKTSQPRWGWWLVRQRILKAQMQGLGSPEGPLVSAMVLGSRVVDLPYEVRDRFAQIGLAHALAASGFQVSLILSTILGLTRRLAVRWQWVFGLGALLLFLGLTGLQPSVLRAVLMGVGALIALATQRKVKPLGSLLLAAVLILLVNPLWIWDLGFQLSFLATLGLLVTVPPLTRWLDWLPPAIAALIAVPLAAYLWTLPLQLYAFGVVSPYSIVVNVLATPLISLISLGGILSALFAVVWPLMGTMSAWLLYYPTHWLIALVDGFAQLPGSAIAVGTISLGQLLLLYGFLILSWLQPWWKKHVWMAGLLAIACIVLPAGYAQANLLRLTVLATGNDPVLLVQNQGQVVLVNSGREATFSLLPFLQQQGVNQINAAITTDAQGQLDFGFSQLLDRLTINQVYTAPTSDAIAQANRAQLIRQSVLRGRPVQFQTLQPGQSAQLGSFSLKLLPHQLANGPTLWSFQLGQAHWLWLGNATLAQQTALLAQQPLPPVDVLWWPGQALSPDLLKALNPTAAIASSTTLDSTIQTLLQQQSIPLYWTGRDGAIQWTPQLGLTPLLGSPE